MKRFKISVVLLAGLLFAAGQVIGQDVVGKWTTIDDETGNRASIVQLWLISGQLYGKVLETWDDDGVTPTDKLCDKCTGSNKDKRIRGMVVINGLTLSGNIWKKRHSRSRKWEVIRCENLAGGSKYPDRQGIDRAYRKEADVAQGDRIKVCDSGVRQKIAGIRKGEGLGSFAFFFGLTVEVCRL